MRSKGLSLWTLSLSAQPLCYHPGLNRSSSVANAVHFVSPCCDFFFGFCRFVSDLYLKLVSFFCSFVCCFCVLQSSPRGDNLKLGQCRTYPMNLNSWQCKTLIQSLNQCHLGIVSSKDDVRSLTEAESQLRNALLSINTGLRAPDVTQPPDGGPTCLDNWPSPPLSLFLRK